MISFQTYSRIFSACKHTKSTVNIYLLTEINRDFGFGQQNFSVSRCNHYDYWISHKQTNILRLNCNFFCSHPITLAGGTSTSTFNNNFWFLFGFELTIFFFIWIRVQLCSPNAEIFTEKLENCNREEITRKFAPYPFQLFSFTLYRHEIHQLKLTQSISSVWLFCTTSLCRLSIYTQFYNSIFYLVYLRVSQVRFWTKNECKRMDNKWSD